MEIGPTCGSCRRFLGWSSTVRLGSDRKAPDEDIELMLRTLTAISRIRLPEGYRTDLPDPIHVKTDFATFDKTYRFRRNGDRCRSATSKW